MNIRKFKKSDTKELSKLMIDTVRESNIKDYTKEKELVMEKNLSI